MSVAAQSFTINYFYAAAASVASGSTTTLYYSASGANYCVTSARTGTLPSNGSILTSPLTSTTTFTLTCAAGGISMTRYIVVSVAATANSGFQQNNPKITIGSLPMGKAGNNVKLQAAASGSSDIIELQLTIDGKLIAVSRGNSLNYNWNSGRASHGIHTVSIRALDAAGGGGTETEFLIH